MASTVWRGYISFGLISIPVRLFRAARAERVSFRRLHRQSAGQGEETAEPEESDRYAAKEINGSEVRETLRQPALVSSRSAAPLVEAVEPILTPVKQVSVRAGTDEVVPQTSVVKGYEYEKNRFVVVDQEELKSAAPKTSTSMEIEEFVELKEIDPVYFETSYYVTPEEAGQKAYALLYRSLQLSGLVAIARFAMHSREHVVVVRAARRGLLAHTMFYQTEVRADEEYRADADAVSAKELELAQQLIHSLAAPFEADKYRDAYRERIESIIAKKVEGQPVAAVTPLLSKQAEVVDIADALRRSLANLKKPVASDRKPDSEGVVKSPVRAKRAGRGS